ncbi:hypothetical protein V2G26_000653 [Clonostachys chloroleuca]
MKSPGQNQYLIRIKTLEFSIKQHSLQPRLLLPSRQTTTRPRPKRLKPSSPPFQLDSTNLSRQYHGSLATLSARAAHISLTTHTQPPSTTPYPGHLLAVHHRLTPHHQLFICLDRIGSQAPARNSFKISALRPDP